MIVYIMDKEAHLLVSVTYKEMGTFALLQMRMISTVPMLTGYVLPSGTCLSIFSERWPGYWGHFLWVVESLRSMSVPHFITRVALGAPHVHTPFSTRPIAFLHLSCLAVSKQVYIQHGGVTKHHGKKGDEPEDIKGILHDATRPKHDIR